MPYQDVDITRRRAAKGETIVAFEEGLVGGVITLSNVASTKGCPFYDRADVASFGQFAVRPARQGYGIGSLLIDLVEQRARENGVHELALDTSENATDLISVLAGSGIKACIDLAFTGNIAPHLMLGSGGIRLVVAAQDRERSIEVLRSSEELNQDEVADREGNR